MSCSVRTWSYALPHRVTRQRVGRPLRLAGLLGRELVGRSTSQGAQQRVGRLLCFTGLLDRDLVGRSASQGCSAETWSIKRPLRVLGLYWAHGSWVPDSSPEPSCKSLDRSCAEAFVGNFRAWVRICTSARCNLEPPGNPCGLLGVYSVYARFRDMPFCDGCHVLSVSSWSLALVEDQIPMCTRAHMQFRDKPFL